MRVNDPNCSPFKINCRDPAEAPSGFAEIVSDDFSTRQPTCQSALNGEFANTRDASVHADGAKSMLAETSGLCIAMEEFITYGHSNLGRGSQLSSLSRLRPTFRASRRKRSNSTTNFSLKRAPNFISWRDQMLAVQS
jgi:hypothetical protein